MSAPQRKPRLGSGKQQLDVRARRERDLRPAVVVRPGPGFGLWTVHDTLNDAERIVTAPMTNQSMKPGTQVMIGSDSGQGGYGIAMLAPSGRLGSAEFTFPQAVGAERHAFGIISADPATLPAGAVATAVTLTGFGLRATDTYRAVLVYDAATKTYPDDTLITLGAVTWTSATEVEIPVSVNWSAPDGHEIRFEVLRAT